VHLYPAGHDNLTEELDDKHNSPATHVATIWPCEQTDPKGHGVHEL